MVQGVISGPITKNLFFVCVFPKRLTLYGSLIPYIFNLISCFYFNQFLYELKKRKLLINGFPEEELRRGEGSCLGWGEGDFLSGGIGSEDSWQLLSEGFRTSRTLLLKEGEESILTLGSFGESEGDGETALIESFLSLSKNKI